MMEERQKSRAAGYTMIELSIVLVVIGLIVVSILKGAAMIHQAKQRKTAQFVEDIRTASNLFYRDRGRLAGDGGIGGFGGGGTWVNGLITGNEVAPFKEELITNGYLKGEKVGAIWTWKNALGGEIYVDAGGDTRNYIVLTNIAEEDRKFFDEQFDGDASDSTGPVRYTGVLLKISL